MDKNRGQEGVFWRYPGGSETVRLGPVLKVKKIFFKSLEILVDMFFGCLEYNTKI